MMGVRMNLTPSNGDGANVTFLMGNNADLANLGTVGIYVDGTLKTVTTDYSISSYTVTFVAAPAATKLVQGDYSTLDRQN